MTSLAAPSQWEGELEDGRTFYLRERHSVARLDVPHGTTVRSVEIDEAVTPHISLQDFLAIFPELELAPDAKLGTVDEYIDGIEA